MSVKITNNAVTILGSGINNVQTTLTVNTGTGSLFPTLTGNDVAYITVSSASNPSLFEIMLVTARSGDTLTVVRGQDGTTAKAFAASDVVAGLQNAAVFTWLRQYTTIPTSAGSANAQTVTNTVPFQATPGLGALQVFMPGFTNTGGMTLNPDGQGAVALKAFGQNLQAGMVVAGVVAVVRHDGTNWELVNAQIPYAQLPQATGTGNAQVVGNTANPIKALVAGIRSTFLPVAGNTGAMTLNQDGTGATAVLAWGAACQGGEVLTGMPAYVICDGVNWNLINPARDPGYAVGSGTNTITATLPGIPSTPYNGAVALVKHANTSTGNTTLNGFNVYIDQGGTTRDPGGATVGGGIGVYVFNSSFNSNSGGWQLTNPSSIVNIFTGTGTGFSSATTASLAAITTSDISMCTLSFPVPAFQNTSNAVTFTITGLPAYLTPVRSQAFYATPNDNTTNTSGSIWLTASSTTITVGKSQQLGVGPGVWTASGTKSLVASTCQAGLAITFALK